jgi:putative resolvase
MVVVVEHSDWLVLFGIGQLDASLAAAGPPALVADGVRPVMTWSRDMIEVLASVCAGLYGRRSARNHALRAVTAARRAGDGVAA